MPTARRRSTTWRRARVRGFKRWNAGGDAPATGRSTSSRVARRARQPRHSPSAARAGGAPARRGAGLRLPGRRAAARRAAYVAGTFDTKGRELFFLRQCLEKLGLRVVTVDLATSGKPSTASVHPREVARHHPDGERAVFSDDRGSAVSAMALAFERFMRTRRDLGGLISAGGSGGTTLATQAMRALPIGVPEGDGVDDGLAATRGPTSGPSDICMMYSVTDVQGINRISEKVLANAAHALAGMIAHPPPRERRRQAGDRPDDVRRHHAVRAGGDASASTTSYDCLVFHATGVGGQSMEKLADSGLLAGVIDVSTTEIADEIVGGVLSAGPTRLDVFARHALPYVGSCGALDMVNFGAWDTVPERFTGAQPVPPQPDRDADAHDGRRVPRDRRVHRRQAQRDARARCAS